MKKSLLILLLAIGLALPTTASAVLIDLAALGITIDDRGTGDTADDMYWIQDLTVFVGMTYDEQITAIADIPALSITTDWHLASYSDILTLWNAYEVQEYIRHVVVGLSGRKVKMFNIFNLKKQIVDAVIVIARLFPAKP